MILFHPSHLVLGEALLKRLYARIGFTDNIIRAEVDTVSKANYIMYRVVQLEKDQI